MIYIVIIFLMHSYTALSCIDSIYKNHSNKTKEDTVKQLIEIFLSYDQDIPLFAEVYNQKGYMQGDYHKWDVLDHTKHVMRNFHKISDEYGTKIPGLQKYLHSMIDNISIGSLTQIAIIYHDAGKKIMKETTGYMRGHAAYTIEIQRENISKRYYLTPQQDNFVKSIITYHDIPPEKIDTPSIDIINSHNAYPAFLLVTLSDIMATMGPAIKQEWIDERSEYVIKSLQKHFSSQAESLY